MNYNIIFWREGKFWIAKCLENSVVSQGLSYKEAQNNIREALELSQKDTNPYHSEISDIRCESLSFA